MKRFSGLQAFGLGIGIAVIFWVGFFFHGLISKNVQADSAGTLSPVFWEAWNVVEEKYPFDEQEPTDEERIHGAIAGMVKAFGDPHTTFFPPQEAKLFLEDVSGEFGGVGMEVDTRDGLITVVAPLKKSPAYEAGVMAGDIIFAVDDIQVYDLDIDTVISYIRGEKGTPVVLTLLRENEDETETLDIEVIRDTIKIPTLDSELITDDVYRIHLYSFTQDSPELVEEALADFKDSGARGLIFDLRSNPGGYLEAGLEIASMFLEQGLPIVHESNGNPNEEIIYRSFGYETVAQDVPVIVLVDGGSASASEIVAGALREHDRAQLVGRQTFGKGSVQELIPLSDNSSVKVTIAKWLTPEGVSLSEGGLLPDYDVSNTINESGEFVDEQLQKAQNLLEKALES